MAILYGTQSNGETLPVLVDQYGNLIAKGIEGPPGEDGDPGTPGQPGPPGADGGSFPLPPNPYEGAILGWKNNELAWINDTPIPIPEGVFGPITAWDSGGLISVEGAIPSQVAKGVHVVQCDRYGAIFVSGWNNFQTWSSLLTSNSGIKTPTLGFDGVVDSNGCEGTGGLTLTPIGGLAFSSSVEVYCRGPVKYNINAANWSDPNNAAWINNPHGSADGWLTLATGGGTLLTLNALRFDTANYDAGWGAVRVDGQLLVDQGDYPDAPNLNLRVNSISGQTMIGVANRSNDFTVGQYLKVPAQYVARWLYGQTTDIDNPRLKET